MLRSALLAKVNCIEAQAFRRYARKWQKRHDAEVAHWMERDDTGGFNKAGEVVLHLPAEHAASVVARQSGGWVRCRLVEPAAGQPGYVASPTVRRASAFTLGGTVGAVHAETVTGEVLGLSEGVPG